MRLLEISVSVALPSKEYQFADVLLYNKHVLPTKAIQFDVVPLINSASSDDVERITFPVTPIYVQAANLIVGTYAGSFVCPTVLPITLSPATVSASINP